MKFGAALLALGLSSASAFAQQALTEVRSATLEQLFSREEVESLSRTLPPDRQIRFRVREPRGAGPRGVIVFVSATNSGELPAHWSAELERRNLWWIAAEDSGNTRPTAERMLAAVMALKLVQRADTLHERRQYIAGFSGGGRVASQCITRFPQLFTGAVFIGGADYGTAPQSRAAQLAARRLVFITGNRDFNRREMKSNYRRYVSAGVVNSLLLDQRGFGHEIATAPQLAAALDFLDAP